MTIAIITGGRNFYLQVVHREYLDALHAKLTITEVVSGGASGVDFDGERWGHLNKIPVKVFAADWKNQGRAAGPKRNVLMGRYADPGGIAIVFPGGRGTASMCGIAEDLGLRIFIYPSLEPAPPCR